MFEDKEARPIRRLEIKDSTTWAIILYAVAICLFLPAVEGVLAQANSTNYALTSGTPVGGGGNSSSTNYGVVGSVLIPGGGIAASNNYAASGGTPAITFGANAFIASYVGSNIQVVTPAQQHLKVTYRGGSGTITGTCYHRRGGAVSYQSAAMQAGLGDTMVYTVPASHLGVRGLEFYFAITDSEGGTSTVGSAGEPFIFITELSNAQAQRPVAIYANHYGIVSVPLEIIGSNDDFAVFGDDFGPKDVTLWRFGSYNAVSEAVNEYPNAANAYPGRAYWLIMRYPKTYGASSFSMRPNNFNYPIDYYEVPLDSGWNQLACPFAFSVNWSKVAFLHNDTLVSGHHTSILENAAYLYSPSNGYMSTTTLVGWDGYFVFIKRHDVVALFPYQETSAAAAKPLNHIAETPAPDNWSLHLRLETEEFRDDGNFIGVRKDAQVGEDNYDLSDPPPPPDAPRLSFRLPEGDPRPRRMDYRPPFTEGAEWKLHISSAPGRVITLTGVENLPAGMEALLIPDNGVHIRLTENQSITLDESTTSARLFIGTAYYLANEAPPAVPDEFTLRQNYPNPFNPFTSISFALAEDRHVALEVYNIIGQRVKTLVDEEMEAGEYIRQWHGADEQGEPVASGIYFYRIKAGNYIQCRKMLLLK